MRLGVIGLGVGEKHLQSALNLGCEVVAICDLDRKKAQNVADKYGLSRPLVTADWRDLLQHSLEAVLIASNDSDHFDQAKLFSEQGTNVFCEKPIATNAENLKLLHQILVDRKLSFGSNFRLRYEPWVLRLKSEIDRGEFGEILELRATYWYGRRKRILEGWRGQDPDYSPILGGGIHMFDLALYLTNSDWVSTTTSSTKSMGANPLHHYDFAKSCVTTKTGVQLEVVTNFASPFEHFHGVELIGCSGSFIRNPMSLPTEIPSADQAHRLLPLKSFLKGLASGEKASIDTSVFQSTSLAIASEVSCRRLGQPQYNETSFA